MRRMLNDNKVINHFRHLWLVEKLFIQGLTVTIVLIIIQVWLNDAKEGFEPICRRRGHALLMVVTYFAQPLLIGVLNIVIINGLYKTKGWQVGFWLNGIFLLLTFTTINLLLGNSLSVALSATCCRD